MSVVIAFKDKDGDFWLAADTRVSIGTSYNDVNINTNKFWSENGVTYAGVGSLPCLQALRYSHILDEGTVLTDKVDAELVFQMYPVWAENYAQHLGINTEAHSYNEFMDTDVIIGCNNKAFLLDSTGSVVELNDSYTIGCGDRLALSYVMSHSDTDNVIDMLANAIGLTSDVDNAVSNYMFLEYLGTDQKKKALVDGYLEEEDEEKSNDGAKTKS